MAATNHAQDIKKETKDFITTALLQLLSSEPLSVLTVSKVCKRAGVSRMAFYRNFGGLEQILYEYYKPKIAETFNTVHYESRDFVKYDVQLKFFDSFSGVLLLSHSRGFEPIIQRIFTEEMALFYAAHNDEYLTAFMSAGAYAIWRKWLLDGRQKPIREIMNFLKKLDTMKMDD
jgi:AcrR family transcriptional regulator